MAINERNVTGRKYRVWDAANNLWRRLSFWTKASDVELDNGHDLQTEMGTVTTNISTIQNKIVPLQLATCGTALNNVAKVVTLSGFQLYTGARISVVFTNTTGDYPTSGNITLNVNNTGAKTVKDGHTNQSTMNYQQAGIFGYNHICEFIYNGTYWVYLNRDYANFYDGNFVNVSYRLSGTSLYITTST